MLLLVFQTLYFLLPAYIANMAPVVVHRLGLLPRLNLPIDRGYILRGARLIGETKTWRGIIVGIATAMSVGTIQYFLWHFNIIKLHTVVDFSIVDPIAFGFIGGVGAMGGDLVKSIIKRRFKIHSGQPWPVFDQLDFVLGYLILTSFLVTIRPAIFVIALLATLILHPLVNIIAFWLRLKKVWW